MKQTRNYAPTFSELIDRMSICILKKIWISENASEYQKEIDLIKADINSIMEEKDGMQLFNADMIEASMVLMLSNRVIWENESKARAGGSQQDKLLKMTHSINGIRNIAKNIISNEFGERKDLKIDSLASDIPAEFGNWKNVFQVENDVVLFTDDEIEDAALNYLIERQLDDDDTKFEYNPDDFDEINIDDLIDLEDDEWDSISTPVIDFEPTNQSYSKPTRSFNKYKYRN